jgi:hypothetical protein
MKKTFILSAFAFVFINNAVGQIISRHESVQSLYLEVYNDDIKLGSATGFIIRSKSRNYLITNYHVVTNKKPTDNTWLDLTRPISPNKIAILHNGLRLGDHIWKTEPLFSSLRDTLWHRNKIGNEMVDVIELPLKDTSGVTVFPVDYGKTSDSLLVSPTDRVFIPGFPLGYQSFSSFPIWKSGFLASEPDIDQENKPIIWIDDVPFPGMSGSPVYLITKELVFKSGGLRTLMGGSTTIFMGVFSHGTEVYGALWKGVFLKKIFDSLP